jgi:hypothetical protein
VSTSIHKPPRTFCGPEATLEPGSGIESADAPFQWHGFWFQPSGFRHAPGTDGGWEWRCSELAARVTRYRNDVWIAGICGTTGHGMTAEVALNETERALRQHTEFSRKILDRIGGK